MVPYIVDGPLPFRLFIDADNVGLCLLLRTKIAKLARHDSGSWQEVELFFLSVPSKQIPKVMAQSMSQQTRKFVLLIHCVVLCQKVGFDPFDLIPFDQVANGCG